MEAKRILIVEDEKPISSILQYGFKKEGFEVRCALTGSEALELAKEAAKAGEVPVGAAGY